MTRAMILTAALVLASCGGAVGDGQQPQFAQTPSDLASGSVEDTPVDSSAPANGCVFVVETKVHIGPPLYDVYVRRLPSRSCHKPPLSVFIGQTYAGPGTSLVVQGDKLAVSFTLKVTPSGSARISLVVLRLSTETLAVLKRAVLNAGVPPAPTGYIYSGTLAIVGNDLVVVGTKSGVIPGETGSGSKYLAFYEGFFTSGVPQPLPTFVVAY